MTQKNTTNLKRAASAEWQRLEDHLREVCGKLNHRVEILAAISLGQHQAGQPDLARAYEKQARTLKAQADSIERLLRILS